MRLTVERAPLLRSLEHARKVIERRTTMPILSNVLLRAEGESLAMTATDTDLQLTMSAPAVVVAAGAATVQGHLLRDLVRKIPEGAAIEIELAEGGGELSVNAGRTRFTLATLPVADFPAMPEDQYDTRFEIEPAQLGKLLDKTRFAMSTEETRYYLNGVHWHIAGEGADVQLRCVATDGHRLARAETRAPAGCETLNPVIVPSKAANEVSDLLKLTDEPVTVELSAGKIRLAIARAVLTSRLIDGAFPDYERVIPTANDKRATLNAKEFTEAIDRVATISSDRTQAVKLAFEAGRLIATSVAGEAGRAEEEADIAYEGEPLEIGFNSRYVLDMMAEIDGETAHFAMANAAAPTVVTQPDDASVLYVLMPMRV